MITKATEESRTSSHCMGYIQFGINIYNFTVLVPGFPFFLLININIRMSLHVSQLIL
jgi:hypothetical protein